MAVFWGTQGILSFEKNEPTGTMKNAGPVYHISSSGGHCQQMKKPSDTSELLELTRCPNASSTHQPCSLRMRARDRRWTDPDVNARAEELLALKNATWRVRTL
jgi:hypothetical protein